MGFTTVYLSFNNKAATLERTSPGNSPNIFKIIADPNSPSFTELIKQGEQHHVEFKMGAYLNKLGKEAKSEMLAAVWISVAAMLNEVHKGYVLIGVTDKGEVCGVEREYEAADPRKPNWDGYSLYLENSLRDKLRNSGAYSPERYKIDMETISNKTVAVISTKKSPKVVWVDNEIYVRKGNKSEKLRRDEIEPYIKNRA